MQIEIIIIVICWKSNVVVLTKEPNDGGSFGVDVSSDVIEKKFGGSIDRPIVRSLDM